MRIRYPGWKNFGPGINFPDPQHCYAYLNRNTSKEEKEEEMKGKDERKLVERRRREERMDNKTRQKDKESGADRKTVRPDASGVQ
jgi:hypothetical protein